MQFINENKAYLVGMSRFHSLLRKDIAFKGISLESSQIEQKMSFDTCLIYTSHLYIAFHV